jgi:hypothetical protein
MAWQAIMTALSPEPQTLFMVVEGTVAGTPAKMAACLAGACPMPAETTFPISTSSILLTSIPALLIASLMTIAPSWEAVKLERLPKKAPLGVRQAERITTSVLADITPPGSIDKEKLAIYFTSSFRIISHSNGKDKQFFLSRWESPMSVEKKKNRVKPGLFGLTLKI